MRQGQWERPWHLKGCWFSLAETYCKTAICSITARWGHSRYLCSSSCLGGATPLSRESLVRFSWSNLAIALAPVLLQFGLFLRWLHRRMRDDEITRAFVRDVALNHLPHIYSALRAIAAEQGITLEEPPLVQVLDLNGQRRRAD